MVHPKISQRIPKDDLSQFRTLKIAVSKLGIEAVNLALMDKSVKGDSGNIYTNVTVKGRDRAVGTVIRAGEVFGNLYLGNLRTTW